MYYICYYFFSQSQCAYSFVPLSLEGEEGRKKEKLKRKRIIEGSKTFCQWMRATIWMIFIYSEWTVDKCTFIPKLEPLEIEDVIHSLFFALRSLYIRIYIYTNTFYTHTFLVDWFNIYWIERWAAAICFVFFFLFFSSLS